MPRDKDIGQNVKGYVYWIRMSRDMYIGQNVNGYGYWIECNRDNDIGQNVKGQDYWIEYSRILHLFARVSADGILHLTYFDPPFS